MRKTKNITMGKEMKSNVTVEDLKEVSEIVKARCAGEAGLDLNMVIQLLTLTADLLLPDLRVEFIRKF